MQEATRDAIVSITLFAAVFGMVYVFLMTRHRERMAILERNLTTTPFPVTNFDKVTVKYGMFMMGIGTGFIMGYLLESRGMSSDISYISMVSLWGGISLILSTVTPKKQKD